MTQAMCPSRVRHTPRKESVVIRRARASDALEFLRLEAECFEMGFTPNTLYYWRPVIDYCWAFKAVAERKVVAGAIAMPTRDGRIYLNSLFVSPAHRRKGIATKLLLKVLRLRPGSECVLDTYAGKPHLLRFYERQGFKATRRVRNYYLDGTTRVMMVRKPRSGRTLLGPAAKARVTRRDGHGEAAPRRR